MPDLILTNACIHTLDATQPPARSIAIRDNKILALGSDDAMQSLLPDAKAIDLHDRCVIPGLIDAHLHAEWTSLGLKNIDAEAPTLDELLRRVEERVKITPRGSWIRGHGWNQNVWGGVFPTKADLDRVAPEHPVYLTAKSGHAAWANSPALKMAGITTSTPNPSGGEIVREANGEPAGIFFEDAMELVSRIIPEPGEQISTLLGNSRFKISRILKEARKRGLVTITIHDPMVHITETEMELVKTFGLDKAIVVKVNRFGNQSDLDQVGLAGAQYLREILNRYHVF